MVYFAQELKSAGMFSKSDGKLDRVHDDVVEVFGGALGYIDSNSSSRLRYPDTFAHINGQPPTTILLRPSRRHLVQ